MTTATNERVAVHEVEVQAFGISHGQLGASLLGTWGLPMPVLEAIACHHAPAQSADTSFSLLTAVHAANVLDYEKKAGDVSGVAPVLADDYITRLNLTDQVNQWREVCGCSSRRADRMSADLTGNDSPRTAF